MPRRLASARRVGGGYRASASNGLQLAWRTGNRVAVGGSWQGCKWYSRQAGVCPVELLSCPRADGRSPNACVPWACTLPWRKSGSVPLALPLRVCWDRTSSVVVIVMLDIQFSGACRISRSRCKAAPGCTVPSS